MSAPTKESEMASRQACRQAEILTTAASCCGVTGETALTDSAIILLYLTSLGEGNTGSLISTSLLPLFNGLAVIPMAVLAPRFGVRVLVLTACAVSSLGYLAAGTAAWIGGGAATVLWGVTCAALVQAGFIAGWFPLLNSFLTSENRVSFLGRMRFFHQLCATVFVLLAGWFIGGGNNAGRLQLVVLLAGLIFCGRFFCILAVPKFPEERRSGFSGWTDLKQAASNRSLLRFSIYQFIFNAGSFGVVPLALLYLKKTGLPDNITVIVSGGSFVGMMLGYWFIRDLTARFGERWTVIFLCIVSLPGIAAFYLLRSCPGTAQCILLTVLLGGISFAVAAFSVISSAVVMACAGRENTSMTMAFGNAFYYGSAGLTRAVISWAAGSAWFEAMKNGFAGSGFGMIFLISGGIMTAALLLAPVFLRPENRP